MNSQHVGLLNAVHHVDGVALTKVTKIKYPYIAFGTYRGAHIYYINNR